MGILTDCPILNGSTTNMQSHSLMYVQTCEMQEGIFIHFIFSSGPQIQRGSSRHGEGRSHGNNELAVEKGEYYGNENTGKNYGFSKADSRARMPLSWYRLTERIWCASLISRKQKGE